MTKHITIYQPNNLGEIEKIEMIDGVVVDAGYENLHDEWSRVAWEFFFHRETIGRSGWNKKQKRETYNDNGREYNSVSGNWEYTADANGNVDPFQCNYEAPQDYQGSVPVWDGYLGE